MRVCRNTAVPRFQARCGFWNAVNFCCLYSCFVFKPWPTSTRKEIKYMFIIIILLYFRVLYSKTTKFRHLVLNEIRWRLDSTVLAAVRTVGASIVCKVGVHYSPALEPQATHTTGASPSFCSMRQLRVLLLPCTRATGNPHCWSFTQFLWHEVTRSITTPRHSSHRQPAVSELHPVSVAWSSWEYYYSCALEPQATHKGGA